MFILKTQTGYRNCATLYLLSVSTLTTHWTNSDVMFICSSKCLQHQHFQFNLWKGQMNKCSEFLHKFPNFTFNMPKQLLLGVWLMKQCLLNCTNYIMLTGRITAIDQTGKCEVPMAHFSLWTVSDISCTIWKTPTVFNVMFQSKLPLQILSVFAIILYMQVTLQARLCSWKMSHQSKLHKSNTKFPFKTVYYLAIRGLTSSNTVYNYTTSGHKDYLLYIQYIYISVQYTYTFVQYICFFLMQWRFKRLTSIVFGTVH
jgi:hypothetical protein